MSRDAIISAGVEILVPGNQPIGGPVRAGGVEHGPFMRNTVERSGNVDWLARHRMLWIAVIDHVKVGTLHPGPDRDWVRDGDAERLIDHDVRLDRRLPG